MLLSAYGLTILEQAEEGFDDYLEFSIAVNNEHEKPTSSGLPTVFLIAFS